MTILQQVKAYLDKRGGAGAGLYEIADDLDLSPDAVIAALRALEAQGQVHHAEAPPPWHQRVPPTTK